jgi:glycosyltransferase involved in cell wall biosynthesis
MRLIYFSPISAIAYAQRPHFTVKAWLDLGADKVLWVNPYPCRMLRFSDFGRVRGLNVQTESHDSRISVLNVPALPIEPLPGGPWLNSRLLWRDVWQKLEHFAEQPETTIIGIGRPAALALMALERLSHKASFYDAMDNFPEFHRGISRQSTRYYENAIVSEVDLVLASSTYLAGKFKHYALNMKKVLNAYPMATLPPWRRGNKSGIVLGYLGCIGRWFDWPLVVQLARQLPQARLELVGPLHVSPPCRLPSNIQLFPPCKQSDACKHLSRFSAGLIPFQLNALTAGVDPIKYYEYRAAGLPVLSTSFGEMALRNNQDGVYFLDQSNDLAAAVNRALEHRDDEESIASFRSKNDWKERFITNSPFSGLIGTGPRRQAA